MEAEVWKYLNEDRRIKMELDKEIEMETWKRYFMGMLDGSDNRRGDRRVQVDQEMDETEIQEEILK